MFEDATLYGIVVAGGRIISDSDLGTGGVQIILSISLFESVQGVQPANHHSVPGALPKTGWASEKRRLLGNLLYCHAQNIFWLIGPTGQETATDSHRIGSSVRAPQCFGSGGGRQRDSIAGESGEENYLYPLVQYQYCLDGNRDLS